MSCATPAFAAHPEDTVAPAASYFLNDYLAFIDDLGGGKINVVYDITAKYTIDELGVTQIEVQRYNNGSWELTAAAFSNPYNNLVQKDQYSILSYRSFDGLLVGGTYRAVLRIYAKNGSIEESRIYTTSSVVLAP